MNKSKLSIFFFFNIIILSFVFGVTCKPIYAVDSSVGNHKLTIINMDNGNFLYARKRFYIFEAVYKNNKGKNDFDHVGIGFTDGVNWINATLDVQNNRWFLESGFSVAELDNQSGTFHLLDGTLVARFSIKLDWNINDASLIDLYQYCNDTSGNGDGWQRTQKGYANIESDLTVTGFQINDTRGNTGQTVEVNGTLVYEGGSVSPPDSEIAEVIIMSSGRKMSSTSVHNGFFQTMFHASNEVGKEIYSIYVKFKGRC